MFHRKQPGEFSAAMHNLHRFGPLLTAICLMCAACIIFSGVFARRLVSLAPWRLAEVGGATTSPAMAARFAALLLMGIGWRTIDASNALFFLAMAIGCALCVPCLVSRFRAQGKTHLLYLAGHRQRVPVGTENELHETSYLDLQAARRRQPGLSLHDFMRQSGGRAQRPAAFFSSQVLALLVYRLDTLVVLMVATGATAVFLLALLAQALPELVILQGG